MKQLLVERASSALADVDTAGWTLRFDLLSDPNRLEILLCLHRAPGICVGDLAEALGRSENAVSQALRVLRQQGWVSSTRAGRRSATGSRTRSSMSCCTESAPSTAENGSLGAEMTAPRVGIFAPVGHFSRPLDQRKSMLAAIGASGIDHVCVGDHVSFHVGAGADALIDAASMLTHYDDLPCYVALYLLPLRHPVLVARQLASIAEIAPGRLTFGVGIGGEDPHELEICGVNPSTRGRRMDGISCDPA